jgi:hypothetical protein
MKIMRRWRKFILFLGGTVFSTACVGSVGIAADDVCTSDGVVRLDGWHYWNYRVAAGSLYITPPGAHASYGLEIMNDEDGWISHWTNSINSFDFNISLCETGRSEEWRAAAHRCETGFIGAVGSRVRFTDSVAWTFISSNASGDYRYEYFSQHFDLLGINLRGDWVEYEPPLQIIEWSSC